MVSTWGTLSSYRWGKLDYTPLIRSPLTIDPNFLGHPSPHGGLKHYPFKRLAISWKTVLGFSGGEWGPFRV